MNRLNPTNRALAAQAWELAQPEIRHAEWVFPGPDYAGMTAWRICWHVPEYDPARSALRTWAINQAKWGVLDARRAHDWGIDSLDGLLSLPDEIQEDRLARILAREDAPPAWETSEEMESILGACTARERALLWGVHAEGRRQEDIAQELGICHQRAGQVRNRVLNRLRERRRDHA